jgi:hypothetical protein
MAGEYQMNARNAQADDRDRHSRSKLFLAFYACGTKYKIMNNLSQQEQQFNIIGWSLAIEFAKK